MVLQEQVASLEPPARLPQCARSLAALSQQGPRDARPGVRSRNRYKQQACPGDGPNLVRTQLAAATEALALLLLLWLHLPWAEAPPAGCGCESGAWPVACTRPKPLNPKPRPLGPF